MTKEALKLALEALECALSDDRPYIVQCKEAITAIKEALAQPEQEPVAWMKPHEKCDRACMYLCTKGFTQFPECASLQRTWVGLTDEEIADLYFDKFSMGELKAFAQAIEAKLKEKNT